MLSIKAGRATIALATVEQVGAGAAQLQHLTCTRLCVWHFPLFLLSALRLQQCCLCVGVNDSCLLGYAILFDATGWLRIRLLLS